MKYFLIFLLFAIVSCKKEVALTRPSFSSDPIHLDYANKIKDFEDEYSQIKNGIEEAKLRINDSSFTPKLAELIKNEIFIQEKYLRLIDQEISYLKMKDNDRSKYYLDHSESLNAEAIKKDYKDYLLAQKVNPKSYIWRKRAGLILPPAEKPKAADKKPADSKGNSH